jgi:hypothetical protein
MLLLEDFAKGQDPVRRERSRAYLPRVIERISGRENCEASSAQHVVSKGNARTLRVHDYRGAQGGKKLAKLSVRRKRTSKTRLIAPVSSDSRQPSRQEDYLVNSSARSETSKEKILMKTLGLALITILLLLFGPTCPTQAQ